MKVCIFGGSFNPIHCGHLALARTVVAQHLADEVWLMVSPQNPLKANNDLWDETYRLALARCATADIDSVVVSDFEFHLPRPSYTYDTLCALREAYPQHTFTLLTGADNWAIFDRWRAHEAIRREFGLIIYPRPDYPIDTATLPEHVTLLDAPLYAISSTTIRQRLSRGEDISTMVPASILPLLHNRRE